VNVRPTDAGPSRRQWILLLCLFVVSLPAVTPRIYSSDEIQYFAYLRSIWFDRDLSFENEYRYFYDRRVARSDGFHETFLERTTDTGRRLNFGTIGCAVLWSPFYAGGHLAAKLTGAPQDGFSKPYIAAVAYGSAIYGFLALVLAIRSAARLGRNGFAAALAVWLGTPLLFYMYLAPPFSHACSAFAVALFIYVWLRVRDEWTVAGLAALGAAGALMAMTREQDVFFIAGPALDFVAGEYGRWRTDDGGPKAGRTVLAVAAAALCFLAVYSAQIFTYRVLNGHLGPHSSVAHKMKWYAPHALEVLFSPQHGYFVWTPLAVLGLGAVAVGAFRGWKETPAASAFTPNGRVWICLLVMAALQVYVGGSVDSWTVAGGFGQRRFVALTAVLVIGLSTLTTGTRRRGAWMWLIALCTYWNLALSAEFATELMDRQKLDPAANAYDAFITLPRTAPQLAWRYLFDRQSFYKAPR
jgi:hypothetical protein